MTLETAGSGVLSYLLVVFGELVETGHIRLRWGHATAMTPGKHGTPASLQRWYGIWSFARAMWRQESSDFLITRAQHGGYVVVFLIQRTMPDHDERFIWCKAFAPVHGSTSSFNRDTWSVVDSRPRPGKL